MDTWESVEKQLVDVKNNSWTSVLQFYGALRSLLFVVEVLPLSVIQPGTRQKLKSWTGEDYQKLRQILNEVWFLIKQDSERITAGIYPTSVLHPTLNPSHWNQLLQIWLQGFKGGEESLVDPQDRDALRDIPSYYRQHLNYTGNNFLNPSAVSLYEHQMELLFLGSMDAMRRLLLAPMKKAFRFSEGEGLRFLEIGCGSGRMSRFIKLTFPKAKLVILDASSVYLKEAQKKLFDLGRIDFIQGDALDLPFREQRFDAVYSSFLLHEMPLDRRRKLLGEATRVVNEKGLIAMVDFIQYDDQRELNWALDQSWFVRKEPFIKEYAQNSLEGIFKHLGLTSIHQERGFLGKAVVGTKV